LAAAFALGHLHMVDFTVCTIKWGLDSVKVEKQEHDFTLYNVCTRTSEWEYCFSPPALGLIFILSWLARPIYHIIYIVHSDE
jgi:hypothetical protein